MDVNDKLATSAILFPSCSPGRSSSWRLGSWHSFGQLNGLTGNRAFRTGNSRVITEDVGCKWSADAATTRRPSSKKQVHSTRTRSAQRLLAQDDNGSSRAA